MLRSRVDATGMAYTGLTAHRSAGRRAAHHRVDVYDSSSATLSLTGDIPIAARSPVTSTAITRA